MNKDMINQGSQGTIKLIEKRRIVMALYIAGVSLYWMSQYLYMPTLPLYVKSKTDNLTMVGVVLAMYGLWQTIIRIPLGMAADWAGWRKPFIIAGVLLSGVGAWVMGAADHLGLLLVGRALSGMAAGTWVLFVVGFSTLFPAGEAVRAPYWAQKKLKLSR